ncbi:MAG: hypothetical protein WBG92_02145 [Thiohalocapsa sp.]
MTRPHLAVLVFFIGIGLPVWSFYNMASAATPIAIADGAPPRQLAPRPVDTGETANPTEQQSDDLDAGFATIVGNHVSVNLRDASVKETLERLAERGAFHLVVEPNSGDRRISAKFFGLEIRQALRRLLDGSTYLISTPDGVGADGNLQVRVLAFQASIPDAVKRLDGQPPLRGVEVESVLRSIDPRSLPAGILDDLRDAAGPPNQALAEKIGDRNGEVLDRLLEHVERGLGTASPALNHLHLRVPGDEGNPAAPDD